MGPVDSFRGRAAPRRPMFEHTDAVQVHLAAPPQVGADGAWTAARVCVYVCVGRSFRLFGIFGRSENQQVACFQWAP